MRYLDTLRDGDRVADIYLCRNKVEAKTKSGKPYLSLLMQDKTGSVDAKIWDLSSGIENFEALDYIYIEGDVTVFQGQLQLNIRRVRRTWEGEYDPADYLPCSPYDEEKMWELLLKYVAGIESEPLRKLAESFFVDDAEFIRSFRMHSAAKTVHHSFVGGLLQHTLRVTQLCNYYSGCYRQIQKDLLIVGALLHDVGKVKELSEFPENDYTDDGQLLGHIVLGYEMVKEHIAAIPNFPKKTASELCHLILSHHGELEYGSPKKPALLEAVALNFADNTDAKLQSMSELFAKAAPGEEWMGFQKLWDSNVRKTTPIK